MILIIIIFIFIALSLYACCTVAGIADRNEEEYYRNL